MKPLQLPLFQPETTWRPPSELPYIGHCKRISVDVETRDEQLQERGPGTRRGAYIVGLALGLDDGRRFYFPTRHREGGNLDEGLIQRWARSELNAFSGEVTGAKLIYDLEHLWLGPGWGVTFPNVKRFKDVQLAEPLLDEQEFEYNLDAISQRRLGIGKQEDLLNQAARDWGFGKNVKGNLWQLPGHLVGPYGEGDADRPLRLLEVQEPLLAELGLTELFELECDLIPVLLRMRLRGVPIDLERTHNIRRGLSAKLAEHLTQLKRLAGPKADWLLADVLGRALDDRNIHVPRTPKTGQYSITKEVLEANAGDALIDVITAGRKLNTIINTFIDGSLLSHHVDGRIYGEFPQLKGDGGGTLARFASQNPNLQNIPVRTPEGKLIRSAFVPEDGERWWRADYCLTGDTRIVTIDGIKTIKELVNKPVPVLSSRDCLSVEFQPVTATALIGNKLVYKVIMQDGTSVRCTGDHRWMTYAGDEILTKDLSPGQRLAHVHDGYSGRYPTWYLRSNRKYVKKHELVAKFNLGPTTIGDEIDHRDGDVENWQRNNLRHLAKSANRGQAAQHWWDKATPAQRAKKIESLRRGVKTKRRSYAGKNNPNYGKKHPGIGGWWYQKRNTNHKVVSIEPAGIEPVYHITVANTHTFVLENGLISHNSQIEYRLMVHYAVGRGAEEARRKYNEDPTTDFHKFVAELLGVDPEDKEKRKRVKNTNFAKAYGARAKKLAVTFNCSVEEAEDFIREYDAALPFSVETFNLAERRAKQRGFVRTILGRYGRFDRWVPRRNGRFSVPLPLEKAREVYGNDLERANTYMALNRVLQGSAADLMKKAMVDGYRAGIFNALGAYYITLHDELDTSVPRTKAGEEAALEMKRIMESAIKLRVPVVADTDYADNWGDAS